MYLFGLVVNYICNVLYSSLAILKHWHVKLCMLIANKVRAYFLPSDLHYITANVIFMGLS